MKNIKDNTEKLQKVLANLGNGSRREIEAMIAAGKISVNGKIANLGDRVDVSANPKIRINGHLIQLRSKEKEICRVLAYYKPVGVTCTERDRFADKKITDMVKFPVRVTYAGRLDKDSEGLILLTNDGELINVMMKGSAGHEKEYIVKVNKEITEDFLRQMRDGVFLKELKIKTRPCEIEQIGKFTYRIVLTQGVNRQIRIMSKSLGYEVKELKRIRVVNVELANLKKGEYRQILGGELQALYDAVYQ